MSYKDYYKILGVSTEASASEVEAAYLKLSARYSSAEFEEDELNQHILQNITEAFMILGEPDLRLEYDAKGTAFEMPDSFYSNVINEEEGAEEEVDKLADGDSSENNSPENPADEIADSFKSFIEKGFKEVIRMGKQRQQKNKNDIHINVPFSIDDAMNGNSITIQSQEEELEVPIPMGAYAGQVLRFAKKGKPSADGQTAGDLWITLVQKPHDYFFRKQNNILYHASIDIFTALLGGNLTIPSLEGKIKLEIPSGITPHTQIKVDGEGLPFFNNPEERGDFIVELHVEMPRDLSEEEVELIKRFRELRKK